MASAEAGTRSASSSSDGKRRRAKPILLNRLEGCSGTVNAAMAIPHEDAVISVSEDATIRVWLKRDSGDYWPSICHACPCPASSMDYDGTSKRLFAGLETGTVVEFLLADDLNRMTLKRSYSAHMARVTDVSVSLDMNYLLTAGRDKYFQWHCTDTGRRLGGFKSDAWCTAVQFDPVTRYVFVADYAGQINVLKLEEQNLSHVTTLKGHSGSIRSLAWDPDNRLLFSGSFDESIIVWDIGSQKGTALELHGHVEKVRGLDFVPHAKKLFSSGDDAMLIVWDMTADRKETPEWTESDTCQRCGSAFFWNFREMWATKQLAVNRQHHCRRCGKAMCDPCTMKTSPIPPLGFEMPVRVCNDCFKDMDDSEKVSKAQFFEMKHRVSYLQVDLSKRRLITSGFDNTIKIWDIKSLLDPVPSN
ncbi:WD repeat and FYVE domain-containing protein 2-like [Sycon ciliatum]|uniref:WD repeat and FYVE domain-containing protein 2-like n=1 Tax=Sycon ciliatum TaxID=27933 RepID=UPI0020A9E4F7|eukprot:scpid58695/ scgid27478/ WD repeat and FYVE domain-containing protein 2; WD40- and FYVE domain-containing protein 2; Zinc finger FYVE domain-containing protein 22